MLSSAFEKNKSMWFYSHFLQWFHLKVLQNVQMQHNDIFRNDITHVSIEVGLEIEQHTI